MANRREQTRERLKERCKTLAEMVVQVRPIYIDPSSSEDQQRFVETVIGAALWYLPEVEECWTGKMSVASLKSCHPDLGSEPPKLTKDHEYPRKLAAAELLISSEGHAESEKLFELYVTKYGRYNYVTPQENKALVQYQRKGVFGHPADAYEKAGVKLLSVTGEDLKRVKARKQDVIEALLVGTRV